MTPGEEHNEAVHDFMRRCIRPLLVRPDSSMGEAMTIYESLTLAFLLLLTTIWGMSPSDASEMVDHAQQQALKRFAAENRKERKT